MCQILFDQQFSRSIKKFILEHNIKYKKIYEYNHKIFK